MTEFAEELDPRRRVDAPLLTLQTVPRRPARHVAKRKPAEDNGAGLPANATIVRWLLARRRRSAPPSPSRLENGLNQDPKPVAQHH